MSRACRSLLLFRLISVLAIALIAASSDAAQPRRAADSAQRSGFGAETFTGIRARFIGPAVTSGRVMSLAVHPANPGIVYVGTASGGLWKTNNGGATWTSIMDRDGSYSIGWVTLDPRNPNVVWVGVRGSA